MVRQPDDWQAWNRVWFSQPQALGMGYHRGGLALTEISVASLIIRKLDEARQILKRALASPERLGDLFSKAFGSGRGADLEISSREPHEPLDLKS